MNHSLYLSWLSVPLKLLSVLSLRSWLSSCVVSVCMCLCVFVAVGNYVSPSFTNKAIKIYCCQSAAEPFYDDWPQQTLLYKMYTVISVSMSLRISAIMRMVKAKVVPTRDAQLFRAVSILILISGAYMLVWTLADPLQPQLLPQQPETLADDVTQSTITSDVLICISPFWDYIISAGKFIRFVCVRACVRACVCVCVFIFKYLRVCLLACLLCLPSCFVYFTC